MAVNPKSLANLQFGRSNPKYPEPKKQRSITVTETGWIATKEKAKQELGISVSEMVELIGRGEIELVRVVR